MRPTRTPSTLLAFALAVAALAVACLADPDPRGDGLTPTHPGDREAVPVPDGGGLAADGDDDDEHKCTEDGNACPQNELVVEAEGPCKGFGEVYDNTNGGCRCLGSLEYDGNGTCVFKGSRPNGGPGPGLGGRMPGGGGKRDSDDDGETEEDSTVLYVSLKCDATTPRGFIVSCKATTKNARGPVYEWSFAPKPDRVEIRDGVASPGPLPPVEQENTHRNTVVRSGGGERRRVGHGEGLGSVRAFARHDRG